MKRLPGRVVLFLITAAILIGFTARLDAQAQPAIRFAFQDRIGSILSILAISQGFFKEQGLTVHPLRFSSGPACAEALYAGAADIAEMGDAAGIIMLSRSGQFVVIASHAAGEHRHRVMVRQDSDFQSLADLIGKPLGVRKGTSAFGGLLLALKQAGLAPEALNLIDLTPPTQIDALLAGSIVAFAASEPTPSIAELRGARELTTLGGLGNTYPLLILANRKMLNHPENLQQFLTALKKAENFLADHYEAAMNIAATETGLPVETLQPAMSRHAYHVRLDATVLDSLKQTALFLKDQNIIVRVPDFEHAILPE